MEEALDGLVAPPAVVPNRAGQRPSTRTAEDRNDHPGGHAGEPAGQRPSTRTAEDRNWRTQSRLSPVDGQRPSTWTAEDRNSVGPTRGRPCASAAAVHPDGRGSQRDKGREPAGRGRGLYTQTAEDRNREGPPRGRPEAGATISACRSLAAPVATVRWQCCWSAAWWRSGSHIRPRAAPRPTGARQLSPGWPPRPAAGGPPRGRQRVAAASNAGWVVAPARWR